MKKKILFSPIGGTDPVRYLRDGSMLHICRVYKPNVVYLYLSKEMLENHRKDNRYVKSIELLGENIDHNFEIHIIEKNELLAAQQYDTFYFDFKEELKKIEDTMDLTDQLIINMASGTPAMKSALLIIATLADYRFFPVQVDSPQKKMNAEYEEREPYDVEVNFELNEDNNIEYENRCTEIRCLNLINLLKIDIIKKHVNAFDYHAALTVANEICDNINPEAHLLLKIADNRVKLNTKEISKLMAAKKYKIFPIEDSDKQKLLEYALVIQLKIQKEEYADFIRGITPLIVDLLETILKLQCGFIVEDYCIRKGKDQVANWNLSKMQEIGLKEKLDDKFEGGFRGGIVYSYALGHIISILSTDEVLRKRVDEIVKIESQARNIAAHEIVSVTEEWFLTKTGKSSKMIFENIKYLIGKAGINANDSAWDSYNQMNQLICEKMK